MRGFFCPALLHVLKVAFLGVCPLLFNHTEIEVLQAFSFLHKTLAAFSSQYLEKSRYHVSCPADWVGIGKDPRPY